MGKQTQNGARIKGMPLSSLVTSARAPIVMLILAIALLFSVSAATPQTITVQGKLTDSSGNALEGTYNISFRIYDSITSGTAFWNDTNHTVVTDSNGIYFAELVGVNLNFTDQMYLGISVMDDSEMSPRLNMTSSPYSLRAQNVSVSGVEFDSNIVIGHRNLTINNSVFHVDSDLGRIGIGTTTPANPLSVVGDSSGNGIVLRNALDTSNRFNVYLSSDDGVLLLTDSTGATKQRLHSDGDSFFGGGNVGIGISSPTSLLHVNGTGDVFNISSGSTPLFIVNSSGRVGIGTSNPTDLFHVLSVDDSSMLKLERTDAGGHGIEFTNSGGSLLVGTTSLNGLGVGPTANWLTDGNLILTSSGNLGLGSHYPNSTLEVVGTANVTSSFASPEICIGTDCRTSWPTAEGASEAGGWTNETGQTYTALVVNITNSNLIVETGRVGIGTNSPSYNVEITDSDGPTIRLEDTTNTARLDLRAEDSSVLIRSTSNYPMRFDVNQVERMRLDTSGQLGIGTIVGAAELHVNSTNSDNLAIIIDSPVNDNYEALQFRVGGEDQGAISPESTGRIYHSAETGHYFRVGSGVSAVGLDRLTIDPDGIGVGTYDPTYLLEVANGSEGKDVNLSDTLFVNSTLGKVGIGLSTPNASLHVRGGQILMQSNTGGLALESAGGTINRWEIRGNTNGHGVIQFDDSNDVNSVFDLHAYAYNFNVQYQSLLHLAGARTIGIGTSTPSYLLEVANGTDGRDVNLSDTFFVNGSSGRVGIGTSESNTTLQVTQQISSNAVEYPIHVASYDLSNAYNLDATTGVGIQFRLATNGDYESLVGASIQAMRESETDTNTRTGLSFSVSQNDENLDEALRITNEGYVGIGSVDPNSTLEVVGTANVTSSFASPEICIGTDCRTSWPAGGGSSEAAGWLNDSGQTYTALDVNLTTGDLIVESGNIGVGTNAPTSGIHLYDNQIRITESTFGESIYIAKLNTASGAGLGIRDNAEGNLLIIENSGDVGIGTTVPNYRLQVTNGTDGRDVNLTNTLFVNSTLTQVGIGTSGPNATLHILGGYDPNNPNSLLIAGREDASVVYSGVQFERAGGGSFFGIGSDSRDDRDDIYIGGGFGSTTGASAIKFFADDEGTTNPQQVMVINGSGNVGIGIAHPSSALDVVGSDIEINGSGLHIIDDGSANGRILYSAVNGVNTLITRVYNVNGFGIRNGADSDFADLYAEGGYFDNDVGIGTTSPSALLDLSRDQGAGQTLLEISGESDNSGGSQILTGADINLGGEQTGTVYGININITENGAAGTIDNAYGIYIADLEGDSENEYGIYSAGVNATNIFSGYVGINVTDPNSSLHVSGVINATAAVQGAELCIGDDCRTSWPAAEGASEAGGWTNETGQTYTALDVNLTTGNLIVESGNVGIGTNNPSEALHIVGETYLEGQNLSLEGAAGGIKYYLREVDSGTLRIGSDTSSGQVQLEVYHSTNPVSLGIDYNGGSAFAYIESVHSSYANNTELEFRPGGGKYWSIGVQGTNGERAGSFEINPSAATYDFFISDEVGEPQLLLNTSTGFVGIGVKNPSRRLEVNGSAQVINGSDGSTIFIVNETTGYVSIGTIIPDTSLHVKGAQSTKGQLHIQPSNEEEYSGITINSSRGANREYAIFVGGTGSDDLNFRIRDNTVSEDRLSIDTSGNVGIGITEPNYLLQTANGTDGRDVNLSGTLFVNGSSGRVGIGTEIPATELQVVQGVSGAVEVTLHRDNPASAGNHFGSLQFWNNGETVMASIDAQSETGNSDSGLRFTTSGATDALIIGSSGNVGIGNTDPNASLQVSGAINASSFVSTSEICLGDDCRTTWPAGGGSSEAAGWLNDSGQTYTALDVNLTTGDLIVESGSVGIGTNAPTLPLHVYVASSGASMRVTSGLDNANGGYGSAYFSNSDGGTTIGHDDINKFVISSANTPDISGDRRYHLVSFDSGYDSGVSNSSPALNIDSSGNIGIGTDEPGEALDIHGNLRLDHPSGDAVISLNSFSTSYDSFIRFIEGGNSRFTAGWDTGADNFDIYSYGTGRDALSIDYSTGNVGIATNFPTYGFQVNGTVRLGNASNYEDIILQTGTASGGYEGVFEIFPATTPGSGQSEQATHFKNHEAAGITRHDILIDGRVGIGIDDPSYKFQTGNGSHGRDVNLSGTLFVNGSSGRVGIGVSNAEAVLQIRDGSAGDFIFDSSGVSSGYDGEFILNDTGLIIGTDSAIRDLRFKTGNLERVVIDTSGNVGIGKATPGVALDVVGGINATTNVSAPQICIAGDCRTSWPVAEGASEAGGWTNETGQTYTALDVNLTTGDLIVESGNIGIGTNVPGRALTIEQASVGDTQIRIQTPSTTISQGDVIGKIEFYSQDTSAQGNSGSIEVSATYDHISNSIPADMIFSVAALSGAATERARLTSNGTLGIGTTDPVYLLTVSNGSDGKDVNLSDTLFVNGSNGRVGIGTDLPQGDLHLLQASSGASVTTYSDNLVIEGGSGSAAGINILTDGTQGGHVVFGTPSEARVSQISANYNSGAEALSISIAGSEAMRIIDGGNVGIGNTEPNASLHVSGRGVFNAGNTEQPLTLTRNGGGGNGTFTVNNVLAGDGADLIIRSQDDTGDQSGVLLQYHDGSNFQTGLGLDGSGNVAIGHIDPNATLDVSGTVNVSSVLEVPQICLDGDCRTTWPAASGSSEAAGWLNDSGQTYTDLNVNLTEGNLFLEGGNITVGASNPGVNLYVNGTGRFQAKAVGLQPIQVYEPVENGNSQIFAVEALSGGARILLNTDGGANLVKISTSASQDTYFAAYNNVGIGTRTPSYLLEAANGTDGRDVNLSNTLFVNGSNGRVGIGTNLPSNLLTIRTDTADERAIRVETSSAAQFFVDNEGDAYFAGNVGLGDLTPSYRLEVSNGTDGRDVNLSGTLFVNGSSAQVGIGTVLSSVALHVRDADGAKLPGSPSLSSDSSAESGFIVETAGGNSRDAFLHIGGTNLGGDDSVFLTSSQSTTSGLAFGTRDSGDHDIRMVIAADGDVGIGTTTPLAHLHVQTSDVSITPDTSADDFVVEGTGTTGISILTANTQNSEIFFGDENSATIGRVRYHHVSDRMAFWTDSVERMTIDSDGHVGIGTDSPRYVPGDTTYLSVGAPTTATGAGAIEILGNRSAGDRRVGRLAFVNTLNNISEVARIIGQTSNHSTSGELAFYTTLLNTSTERMIISDVGNVGIGNSDPNSTLDVSGTVNVSSLVDTPQLCLGGDCRTSWPAAEGASSAGGWYNETGQTYSDLDVNLTTGNLVIESGRLGIGTNNPTDELTVVGDAVIGSVSADSQPARVDISSGASNQAAFIDFGYHTGSFDANIFNVGRDANDDFFISDSGSGTEYYRFFIDGGNGNIGIGKTEALAKLDINGSLYITNNSGSAVQMVFNQTTGRLGIGIDAPTAPLHINHTSAGPHLLVEGGAAGQPIATFSRHVGGNGYVAIGSASGDPQLNLDPENSGTRWSVGVDDDANDDFVIASSSSGETNGISGGSAHLVIDTSGNVGIGTSSPTADLEVDGTINITGSSPTLNGEALSIGALKGKLTLHSNENIAGDGISAVVQTSTDSDLEVFVIETGADVVDTVFKYTDVGIGNSDPTYLLEVANGTDGKDVNLSNTLFVNGSNGRVGLGTDKPVSPLHIYTTDASIPQRFERASGSPGTWDFTISSDPIGTGPFLSGGSLTLMSQTASTDFAIRAGDTGDPQVVVLDTGEVGINSTSPSELLEVGTNSQALTVSADKGIGNSPQINTTGESNVTITSEGGSVIIRLG